MGAAVGRTFAEKLDLAELQQFELARGLAIDLLKRWLVPDPRSSKPSGTTSGSCETTWRETAWQLSSTRSTFSRTPDRRPADEKGSPGKDSQEKPKYRSNGNRS